jgi:hypothetical protein
MKIRLLLALAVAMLALTTLPAQAGYEYSFDSTSYTVGVGQTVNVNVYLTQTGSTTGLSGIGLQSGGVQLNYNTTFVSNSTAQISPNNTTYTGTTPTGFNPLFNYTLSGNGSNGLASGSSIVEVSQGNGSPVLAGSGSPNTANSILLGTFQFTGVSVGQSLLVSTNSFSGDDVNVLADGTVLDGMIQNSSAVINVVAVPEPGTLILTGLFAFGIVGSCIHRRYLRNVAA